MAVEINGTTGIDKIQNGAIEPSDYGSPFFENPQAITADYVIPENRNAGTFGDVDINSGVTVTISNNATWVIV